MPAGPHRARPRHPHDGLSAPDGGVRRRVHLHAAGRHRRRSASSPASTTGPDVRSARRVPALQAASVRSRRCSKAGRWSATAPRRCPRAAGTRFRASYADGALIAGDAAGFMNSMRLKGIHLAMRTGMLAAETAFDAVAQGDTSRRGADGLRRSRSTPSAVRRELYPVRNVHQAFSYGLVRRRRCSRGCRSSPAAGGSRIRCRRTPATSGCRRSPSTTRTRGPIPSRPVNPVKIDRQLTFDRLTNVHYSGTRHPEDQPSHLDRPRHRHLPRRAAARSSAIRACASARPTSTRWSTTATATKKLHINASNCVHCKTCDIMDPYQIIDWVPPEGGGGPAVRRHVIARHAAAAARPRAIAARRRRRSSRRSARTYRWRDRRRRPLRRDRRGRPAADPRVLARAHSAGHALLPRSRHRRHDQPELRRRVDRAASSGGSATARRAGRRRAAARARWCSCGASWRTGHPAAFTVDGPRGPARVAQPGAVWLAGATGHPILPFHIEANRFWTAGSWDRDQMPKPCSTVAIAIGAPIYVPDTTEATIEAKRLELERARRPRERACACRRTLGATTAHVGDLGPPTSRLRPGLQ